MFASDGIVPIGGVAPVGMGMPPMSFNNSFDRAIEHSRIPLTLRGISPSGTTRPILNIEVQKWPFQKTSERAPGLSTIFGNVFLHLAGFLGGKSEPTRKNNIPTQFESVTFLTGMPGPPPDPEGRGMTFEKAPEWGIDFGEGGNFDVSMADSKLIETISNNPNGEKDADISKRIQPWDTNENDQLLTFRASYPSVSVEQAPTTTRSVVLVQVNAAGQFEGEMAIPDGSVTCRIAWTGKLNNDLWANFSAQANLPLAANQPGPASGQITQASILNDGPLLNPDETTKYLVKGKRAISFSCNNTCIVNVTFYQQA